MRMKKDKEKPGHNPSQRHSSAANYEINAQSAMMHSHSDEYVLELFEQMLVRKILKVYVYCVCKIHYLPWTAMEACPWGWVIGPHTNISIFRLHCNTHYKSLC